MTSAAISNQQEVPPSGIPAALAAAWWLAKRELVRFFRQRGRVMGALGQPIIFWILFGAGLGPSFQLPGAAADAVSYREYFFPGTLVLIVLFTAIFTTISVIEDRREGFLQGVLVAPVPRWAMVLGKVAGGTVIATLQAALFLAAGWWLGLPMSVASIAATLALLLLIGAQLTSLGFLFAWRLDSSQGFHAVMSLVLLPMWLLSGAFFPAESGWLSWLMAVNPLTYGVAAARHLLYLGSESAAAGAHLPSLGICLLLSVVFTVLLFAAACATATRTTRGDLL